MDFKKFNSIDQFRNLIKTVRDTAKYFSTPLPVIKFTGTTKVHGTNACIAYNPVTDAFLYQSRENPLSLTKDNAGFCMWGNQDHVKDAIKDFANQCGTKESIYVYGEWAGGNIQKHVGVTGLGKKFLVFKVVSDEVVQKLSCITFPELEDIHSILKFKTWEIEIDFSKPEVYQNQLVEWTLEVENECPVAKYFGVNNGVGEGIVYSNEDYTLTMKVKGEKHSSSKVNAQKAIAAVDVEKMASMRDFVDYACSDNRMAQGVGKLKEAGLDVSDNKNIGTFIKWVVNDIIKEEADTLIENQIDVKKIGGFIAEKCRTYYFAILPE